MKVNRALIAIKMHYFLRYAGSAFMTMVLPLMVRQKQVSEQGIGFLWSLLPMVGLIANSVSGALADYFRAHRTVFLLSLTFLTVGLSLMYILPSIPTNDEAGQSTLGEQSSFSNRPIFVDAHDGVQGFHITENATHFSLFNSTSEGRLKSTSDLFQTLVDPEMVVEEGQAFPPDPKISAGKEPESSEDNSMLSTLMRYPQFWLICIAMLLEQIGLSTCVMISDAVCFQILGDERHKYGQQRVWGTIGMGLMSIATGALVDLYSKGLPQTDYLPAIIICLVLMTADLIVVARMKIPYTHGSKIKMGDVGNVISHPQTFLFIATVYVMGTSLGLLWVFKLIYIEDVTQNWDPTFSNLRLLQGLDMGIETFGGEVPFFFLSGIIIQRMGHKLVFATSLTTLALRCCLYYTVSNPWWFLPIELLNGISYGLFHTCMASFASHIAPEGAQATLQAIVRASMTTGQASAGFLGGILYQTLGGAQMFLAVGLFDFGFCIVFGISQVLINKYYDNTRSLGKNSYEVPSNNSSSEGRESREESPNVSQEEKETENALMDEV